MYVFSCFLSKTEINFNFRLECFEIDFFFFFPRLVGRGLSICRRRVTFLALTDVQTSVWCWALSLVHERHQLLDTTGSKDRKLKSVYWLFRWKNTTAAHVPTAAGLLCPFVCEGERNTWSSSPVQQVVAEEPGRGLSYLSAPLSLAFCSLTNGEQMKLSMLQGGNSSKDRAGFILPPGVGKRAATGGMSALFHLWVPATCLWLLLR